MNAIGVHGGFLLSLWDTCRSKAHKFSCWYLSSRKR
jgi:hypothetical protein